MSDFELKLISLFTGTWWNRMRNGHQGTVDDVLEALNLIVDRYLEKSSAEMVDISKYERGQKMKPVRETKTIAEDLLESEKCLGRLLNSGDMQLLRQLSTQIRVRNE